jgi:hypothetical protein
MKKISSYLKFLFGFLALWTLLISSSKTSGIQASMDEDLPDGNQDKHAFEKKDNEQNLQSLEQKDNDKYLFVDCTGFFE